MAMHKYNLKKDGNTKLTDNFKVKEFKCNDGSDVIYVSGELVAFLQQIRNYFGKPVKINSAYRTPTYNKKVGGAVNSQHTKGTAADIKITGVPVKALAAYCDQMLISGGVGYYNTFVHVDVRGYKSRWLGSAPNKGITGFNLGNTYTQYKG